MTVEVSNSRWRALPVWSIAFPLLGLAAVLLPLKSLGAAGTLAAIVILIGSVIAAVHHAEVVAHRVGEPFGTLGCVLIIRWDIDEARRAEGQERRAVRCDASGKRLDAAIGTPCLTPKGRGLFTPPVRRESLQTMEVCGAFSPAGNVKILTSMPSE